MTKTELTDYIDINHHYMIVQDTADEAFTVYNQTGSDLLDEYRGIKTTGRV